MTSLPRFKVLAAICRAGSLLKPNDDAYGVARRGAFVLDGATGLGEELLLKGKSDAAWVAIEAAAMLAGLADLTDRDVGGLVDKTVAHLIAAFAAGQTRPPKATYEIPFASMMTLVGSPKGLEIGSFGDCRLLAVGVDGAMVTGGPGLKARSGEQDRAREMASTSGAGASTSLRQELLPRLRELRNFANSREGTGVLGPDPRCLPLLRRKSVTLALPATALLMSDGFYALVTDYRLYDDASLVAAAKERGLGALYDELRAFESRDPDGTRFPRFKTHDDATALLVSIHHAESRP